MFNRNQSNRDSMRQVSWSDVRPGQVVWMDFNGVVCGPFMVVDPDSRQVRNMRGVQAVQRMHQDSVMVR